MTRSANSTNRAATKHIIDIFKHVRQTLRLAPSVLSDPEIQKTKSDITETAKTTTPIQSKHLVTTPCGARRKRIVKSFLSIGLNNIKIHLSNY